ncbi:FUSC family protein [Pseudonocardia kujensis]|uniref:FUSC family protein n=1 Tax=Pseudonocardia kujensis TaxID=1128675 RepID=UPI001E478E6B|nr:FUSC family protein [Pseudonocardia kujensis]MCE0766447.1 FUSC family protein [Pseudonocardia kujensis]
MRPPVGPALRRSIRVSVPALVGFYGGLYGLGNSVVAIYALFTVIALGALSEVTGPPDRRLRTFLAAVAAGVVLVTLGTLLAVSTWAAAAGMLVVGFVVAYAGTGGPRVVGVVNGLQLLYVLPCFPPFQPDTLDQRLLGLVLGGALLIAADRWLLPRSVPTPVPDQMAVLADKVARFAGALADSLRTPAPTAPQVARHREILESAEDLRITRLPREERPLGPGRHDRSLLATAAAIRASADRSVALADLMSGPGEPPHPRTADLVAESGRVLAGVARTLRAGRQALPVDATGLDAALAAHSAARVPGPATTLRSGLAAVALAEDARLGALAVSGWSGAPRPAPAQTPPMLWFLHAGPVELWWRRLRSHLTPRSIYLQNAVRLALGLAVARVVAGVLDLQHGFWVLLATLSLMRTSASADRSVLARAFAGTLVGAVLAAGVLVLVGDDRSVYGWLLPVVMVATFAAGPLLGIGAAQAGFTVLVAALFAQLSPATWHLAEVRLVDVLVGGLVGALIGAAVWPRGGGAEVRQVAADALRAVADDAEEVAAVLAGAPVPVGADDPGRLHTTAVLLEHAYVQYRTEPMPRGAAGPDWLTVVLVVHRLDAYDSALRDRHPAQPTAAAGPAGPDALQEAAADIARAYRQTAEAVDGNRVPDALAEGCRERFPALPPEGDARLLDGWGWLHALCDNLSRVRRALAGDAGPPVAGDHHPSTPDRSSPSTPSDG